jgi:triphosphoribosyl-dephospho-CoA synthase
MNNTSDLSRKLSSAYRSACMGELEALKPGNVHIFADGHGMTIDDFIKSAEVSAIAIAEAHASVGERIYNAVKVTHATVGMNTNLGVILLCAPLIHAAFHRNKQETVLQSLSRVLHDLTIDDAKLAAQAIVLANPAGLGRLDEYDVENTPQVSLLTLMQFAQNDDRIAWQYANAYADLFDFGLPLYDKAFSIYQNQAWATTALYLAYLTYQPDTHIIRKHNQALAAEVMAEAQQFEAMYWATDNPKLVQQQLLSWDESLKKRRLNPGTSADLTVATLLLKLIS